MIIKPALSIARMHQLVMDNKVSSLTLIDEAYNRLHQQETTLQAFREIGEAPDLAPQ